MIVDVLKKAHVGKIAVSRLKNQVKDCWVFKPFQLYFTSVVRRWKKKRESSSWSSGCLLGKVVVHLAHSALSVHQGPGSEELPGRRQQRVED